MEKTQSSGEFSESQRAGLDVRQADQDRTLAGIHRLEAMLAAAAPGREQEWRSEVLAALVALEEATAEEADNAQAPDSLLSDLARTQPWLRNRVRGVRLQYQQIRHSLGSLRKEMEEATGPAVGGVLTGLRHQRARESDLIYEAYYDAFRADLATEANRKTPTDRHQPTDKPEQDND
ncbi:MAG: hypothetical protein E6G27_17535 [Actinobacteria bacterium]|nr:MAG: hypothetical protein E6G27_17535 [Actinomycetota bacterium]